MEWPLKSTQDSEISDTEKDKSNMPENKSPVVKEINKEYSTSDIILLQSSDSS